MTPTTDPTSERPDPNPDWTYPQRVLLATAVLLLLLLVWRLTELVILLFGSVLVATALVSMSGMVERHLRVPRRFSLAATILLIIVALGLVSLFLGGALTEQFETLRERIPAAADAVLNWANTHRVGMQALQYWESVKDGGLPWTRIAGYASLTLGALGSIGLMIVMGLYIAASPDLYRDGLLRLTPHRLRPRLRAALVASGVGLSGWLQGQAISMLVVGGATAIGLWLLGIPLALAIGLISGLLTFIPFFGAIVGGLLAVLLSFVEGPTAALYVAILCIAIQQLEGHVITPIVQSRTVALPPVLGLVATVVFGLLFGLMGVLFATPLMVVVMILVQMLYVDAVIDRQPVPRDPGAEIPHPTRR